MSKLSASYRLVILIFTILVSSVLLLSSMSATTLDKNQAFARCPAGTHKSPSGDCETVASHAGLPRCPNGFHRSPGGICEPVASPGNNGGSTSSSSGLNTEGRSTNGANNNNISPLLSAENSNNNNNINPTAPSLNISQSTPTDEDKCDQSLWNHVYNPQRLQVVSPCKSVLGVIESKRVEKDGDYHIRVKLDPPFSNLINSANIKNQLGDLVVEPICVNKVTQADAIPACQNFHQNIVIPSIGSHVNITGSYILDKEHGNWAEIHPVTSITKIP
jgi:hypothetical protein